MEDIDDAVPLFAAPVKGVFLDARGRLFTGPTSRRVLPLSNLAGRLDGPAQLSVGDVPMSTLAGSSPGGLAGALGVSLGVADAVKILGEAVALASGVVTGAGLALKALEAIGVLGGEPDPFEVLYDRIEAELRRQWEAIAAGQQLQTMQTIAGHLAHTTTAGAIVGDHLRAPSPSRGEQLEEADYWSRFAVNALAQEPLWLRVHDPRPGRIRPETASRWSRGPATVVDGLVWDWRLPLLAYLKAVTVRVVVIRAIDPHVDVAHRDEILGYASHLQAIEGRIRGGLARTVAIPYPGHPYWNVTAHDACGVLDVHSGAEDLTPAYTHAMSSDPIDRMHFAGGPAPTTHQAYLAAYEHGVSARYWRLYAHLGMLTFWQMIPDLQAASAGEPRLHRIDTRRALEHLRLPDLTRVGLHASLRRQLGRWQRDR